MILCIETGLSVNGENQIHNSQNQVAWCPYMPHLQRWNYGICKLFQILMMPLQTITGAHGSKVSWKAANNPNVMVEDKKYDNTSWATHQLYAHNRHYVHAL